MRLLLKVGGIVTYLCASCLCNESIFRHNHMCDDLGR